MAIVYIQKLNAGQLQFWVLTRNAKRHCKRNTEENGNFHSPETPWEFTSVHIKKRRRMGIQRFTFFKTKENGNLIPFFQN